MEEIKSYLLEFIWSGKDISGFEEWLYQQNSIDFGQLIGEENYLELISYDYSNEKVNHVKQFVKKYLSQSIIQEFEEEFQKRKSKIIKGTCIKKTALDYFGKNIKKWDIEVGKEYEFLKIILGLKSTNHDGIVIYIDRTFDLRPSGYIPMELFDIDLNNISDLYHKTTDPLQQTIIELLAFSDKEYIANEYSFWEDFHNSEPKAEKTYFETLEKIGIKKVW